MQGLFALDALSAQEAMLQFQSCVRTTLLLCDGYECQEKVQSPACAVRSCQVCLHSADAPAAVAASAAPAAAAAVCRLNRLHA